MLIRGVSCRMFLFWIRNLPMDVIILMLVADSGFIIIEFDFVGLKQNVKLFLMLLQFVLL